MTGADSVVSVVAHSMGGLVARSACYHAATPDGHLPRVRRWLRLRLRRVWPARVRRVILLGVPNAGSWIAVGLPRTAS